jgi:viroplasmin and RNaseH domain-containing protein
MGGAAKDNSRYYGVRSGLKTGVFRTWGEVVPLTRRVKGSLFQRFPTREQAEVFATAEKLYAVDKVGRNEVLEPNHANSEAFPAAKYKFFATRQEAETFSQSKEASDAEASPAKVTSDPTSEDAGKVALVRCWRR